MKQDHAGYQILFLTGSCVLGYEILLTRAASAFFQYHFAFLVLSIAMFSLFASGVLYQRLKKPISEQGIRQSLRALYGFLLISPVLFYAAMPMLLLQTGLQLCGFAVLFCGSFITLHYLRQADDTGLAYAINLFGSALGAGLATVSLVLASPALGVMVLGALSALSIYLQFRRLGSLLVMTALLALSAGLSVYLPRAPDVLWERWNSFSYIKVMNALGPVVWGSHHHRQPPSLDLLIDSSADTAILTSLGAETRDDVAKDIADDITHVGYSLAPLPLDVAIVGSGGGRDVVGAEFFHPRHILAVEINPSVIEAVRRFSPDTYAGVDLVVGEGRATLEKSPDHFSIIQFGLVDTWAAISSGTFALSENYLYTREAFIGYLSKLTPEGILSLTRWGPESERLLSVSRAALASLGLDSPSSHMILLEKDAGSPDSLVTVLLKRTPWSTAQRLRAQELATASGYRIRSYVRPSSRPALDDSPFFFYNSEGSKVILLSIGVLTLASMALFFVSKPGNFVWHLPSAVFFGTIGMAYMLVENVFLQKFILLIRDPTLAISTVFLSFLLFSGLGSLNSRRIRLVHLALLVPLLVLFSVVSGPVIAAALTLNLPAKLLLTASCIAPVAFLMGLFFPTGFERIKASRDGSEGMAWAVNGLFSVIAPPVALFLAVTRGFGMVLLVAAGLYSIACWAWSRLQMVQAAREDPSGAG
jgi:hypothetical protein